MSYSQKKLSELLECVRGVKTVYIVIYSNVDPDSISSAWGLKELFKNYGIQSQIGYTGKIGRIGNKTMIDKLNIPVHPIDKKALDTADKVAIVDAQLDFFKNQPLERCDIVIDHHPRKSNKQTHFSDIRPHCLPTASIITNYLIDAQVKISRGLATALHHGIQVDSTCLLRKATDIDKKAIFYLTDFINHAILREISLSHYSLETLDYFKIAIEKKHCALNIIYSHIGTLSSADICSQIADFFIKVKDIEWSIVSGTIQKKLIISFRSQGEKNHSGKLAEKSFGHIGSAGGHDNMARAEIDETSLPKSYLSPNNAHQKFILERLSHNSENFLSLAQSLYPKTFKDQNK